MGDVLVTDHTPTLGVGRALRTYAVARALAAHGPVDVVYVRFGAEEPSPEWTGHPNLRLHPVEASRGLRRGLCYAAALAAGMPQKLARTVSPEIASSAAAIAPPKGQGRLIGDGIEVSMALRGLRDRHDLVHNAHNLESAFQHELGDARSGSTRALARIERKVLGWTHESWMVSRADLQGARELAPGARLRYVPNVVDVAAIEPRTARAGGPALLVADYTWEPNRQAAAFLLQEVMPRVWAAFPDARLVLAGRGLDPALVTDPRVEALGFVDDLEGLYDRAACVLVPLLSGGGSPLKFVEGLAHGLPVLATSVAARGLELEPGVDHLRADGPTAYAEALVGLLRDGDPGVGARGRRAAQERYSIERLTELLAPGAPASR